MDKKIREPKQLRSVEKKNRIVQAGYELFAEKGYINTNTAEIAKKAGVSVGLVYGYFNDKRDILLDVLDIYINNVFAPILDMFGQISPPLDFEKTINNIVDKTIELHKNNALIHEALHSMTYMDEEINNKFLLLEDNMTEKIVDALKKAEYSPSDVKEKVHLAIETIQSYAHECIYDNHKYINYSAMRENVIKMLLALFKI
ncbi:MAG: TetR/AcrR family transcriptional regulator [Clostridia bacterium]|nr:TetR/AcrR family transcriptional regulator [Clostridia bacterium]